MEKSDTQQLNTISTMQRTSQEEFIVKALRQFLPHKGISVYFVGNASQGVTGMETGFEVAIGERLSSAYDRLVEYFIPLKGGVVKVLGMDGGDESDPTGELMTKTIDTRNHLALNILTIIKDLI